LAPGRVRLLRVMISRRQIRELSEQIVREFKPDRIILFGSHAYGRPTDDSDLDLLVVMPFRGKDFRQAVRIASRLPAHLPVDVIVRTPETLRRRLDLGDFFLREIIEKGRVLYATPHGGVGQES